MRRVLIHSPFTGPSAWRAVASLIPGALAVDYGGVTGPDFYEGAAARIAAQVGDGPWIAVLHSSAGSLAPTLAAASASLAGFLFVDAVMPHPGKSAAELAPEAQMEGLRRISDAEGRLAPWNTWFPQDPTEAWIPDPDARATFIAELPRTPIGFLEAVAPDNHRWESLPSAFVRLSAGYEANAVRAEERGWPARRAELNHLAMIGRAEEVSALLGGLP